MKKRIRLILKIKRIMIITSSKYHWPLVIMLLKVSYVRCLTVFILSFELFFSSMLIN